MLAYSIANPDNDDLPSEFAGVRAALHAYLAGLDYGKISNATRTFAGELYWELANQNVRLSIINFNYTPSFKHLRSSISNKNVDCFHIHGSIDQANIVFGVADEETVGSQGHLALKKSFQTNQDGSTTVSTSVGDKLSPVRQVHFFGHSLGPTDHFHFREFFRNSQAKEIFVYYYGEADLLNLRAQLDTLTGQAFAIFSTRNRVVRFLDCSKTFRPEMLQHIDGS